MRVFISGNEDVCRWHLPVAQAKALSFAERCEKSGLKQNTFHFRFEETGAVMQAQYAFGQLSLQIYAPFIHVEEVADKSEDVFETGPKTFWVNTTRGYFWVEVRYDDEGLPNVTLTQFVATTTAEVGSEVSFVYPGFAINAPGMYAYTLADSARSRYVVAQDGAAIAGVDEEKGSIVSVSRVSDTARMTILGGDAFLCVKNNKGKSCRIARVSIVQGEKYPVADVIEFEFSMLSSTRNGILSVANLHNGPCFIHRKCSGSYFSPNKTIGYHVDIGSDDSYFGNLIEIPSGIEDKVDNDAGYDEAVFNHTQDLYRMCSLLSFPMSVSGNTVEILLLSPAMCFDALSEADKCWGGYGWDGAASCADYLQDFSRWVLAPRPVRVSLNLVSGTHEFSDTTNGSFEFECSSWCGSFYASVEYLSTHLCESDSFEDYTSQESSEGCSWVDDCSGICSPDPELTTYEASCPGKWTPYIHRQRWTREEIKNKKHFIFSLGTNVANAFNLGTFNGFFFLFDGLWHLDVGLIWTTADMAGDGCGICSSPAAGQTPGLEVIFKMNSPYSAWILENGHEYVRDLEIVAPLGYHSSGGSSFLGFIAKVPESLAAPTPPKVLLGGVSYPSPSIEGEVIYCEHELMSRPCTCNGSMEFSAGSLDYMLGQDNAVLFYDGCPPFRWSVSGGILHIGDYVPLPNPYVTDDRSLWVLANGECSSDLRIVDACQQEISLSATYPNTGYAATGPEIMQDGTTARFYHNLDDAEYTGSLTLVTAYSDGALLLAPPDSSGMFTASWSGKCGTTAAVDVGIYTPYVCPYPSLTCGSAKPSILGYNGKCYRPLGPTGAPIGTSGTSDCVPFWGIGFNGSPASYYVFFNEEKNRNEIQIHYSELIS